MISTRAASLGAHWYEWAGWSRKSPVHLSLLGKPGQQARASPVSSWTPVDGRLWVKGGSPPRDTLAGSQAIWWENLPWCTGILQQVTRAGEMTVTCRSPRLACCVSSWPEAVYSEWQPRSSALCYGECSWHTSGSLGREIHDAEHTTRGGKPPSFDNLVIPKNPGN